MSISRQLLSDILDVSRIAAGKLRLQIDAVDLASVIEAAVETVRPSAMERQIQTGDRADRN